MPGSGRVPDLLHSSNPGEYVFWPDPRLVFQSLAQKYGAQLSTAKSPILAPSPNSGQSVCPSAFRVASALSVGAARVPGFTGSATSTVRGVDTFASYIARCCGSGVLDANKGIHGMGA